MEYPSLKGKVAIVTGSGSGIGEAIAKKLSESGVILSLIDMNEDKLKSVAESCVEISTKFNNPKPFVAFGDLTIDAIRQKYVEDTLKQFGRLDILVNNAGIAIPSSMFDSSMEAADKLFGILLRAPYDMCRLCSKHLIKTEGSIINIASIAASQIVIVNPGYHAAKAGIAHLTKSVADELGPYNVRVNSISPGVIITNIFNEDMMPNAKKMQEQLGQQSSVIKRAGQPEEVAKVAAFLLSDQNSYMTGSDIVVDGGMLIKRRCDIPDYTTKL